MSHVRLCERVSAILIQRASLIPWLIDRDVNFAWFTVREKIQGFHMIKYFALQESVKHHSAKKNLYKSYSLLIEWSVICCFYYFIYGKRIKKKNFKGKRKTKTKNNEKLNYNSNINDKNNIISSRE